MSDRDIRLGGIGRLYGVAPFERLAQAHVCICGIGGVGSWTAEALARSGVGALTLIDMDDICETNINRQLHALVDTVGLQKVDVMARRIREIAPQCEVTAVSDFILKETIDDLIGVQFDVVIDAIDDLFNKCLLIAHCHQRNIPIVTVGGAGGRRDPTAIMHADLLHSTHDGLLRRVRQRLKRDFGFEDQASWGISSVFSRETPVYPTPDGGVSQQPSDNRRNMDCASGFGTASFVTGTFGFVAASLAMDILTDS